MHRWPDKKYETGGRIKPKNILLAMVMWVWYKARLWYAERWDDKHPEYCRASIILWAMGYPGGYGLRGEKYNGCTWCGKCGD